MTEADVALICHGLLADDELRGELADLVELITPPTDRAPSLPDMMRAASAFTSLAELLSRARVRGALAARAVTDGTP